MGCNSEWGVGGDSHLPHALSGMDSMCWNDDQVNTDMKSSGWEDYGRAAGLVIIHGEQ